jgi:hypothetical protein
MIRTALTGLVALKAADQVGGNAALVKPVEVRVRVYRTRPRRVTTRPAECRSRSMFADSSHGS